MNKGRVAMRVIAGLLGLAVGFSGLGRVYGQSPVTVRLVDGYVDNLLTPNALAVVSGLPAAGGYFYDLEGKYELGGYSASVEGVACRLTYISPEWVTFLVDEKVVPSEGLQALIVQGPGVSQVIPVTVVPYHPIVVRQAIPGNLDVECCSVVMGMPTFTPVLYVGEVIPVGRGTFNYLSMSVRGFLTGYIPAVPPFEPVVHLARITQGGSPDDERWVPGRVFASPGFPGAERVGFFAPQCLSGVYRVTVEYGGLSSNGATIRFASDCGVERSLGGRGIR